MYAMKRLNLKKRIKLKNEVILDIIKDINEDFNIDELEVQKFLLIFHTLMKVVSSDEGLALPDGAVTDSFFQVVLKISELLKYSIDSLKLSEFLKTVLKKMKILLNKLTDQDPKHTGEAEKTSEATRNRSNKAKKIQNKKIYSTTKKR